MRWYIYCKYSVAISIFAQASLAAVSGFELLIAFSISLYKSARLQGKKIWVK